MTIGWETWEAKSIKEIVLNKRQNQMLQMMCREQRAYVGSMKKLMG